MKLCLFCNYMYFSSGYPGYSEYTPGAEAQLYCMKNRWDVIDKFDDLHESLLMAEHCEDYSIDSWAKERYGLKED